MIYVSGNVLYITKLTPFLGHPLTKHKPQSVMSYTLGSPLYFRANYSPQWVKIAAYPSPTPTPTFTPTDTPTPTPTPTPVTCGLLATQGTLYSGHNGGEFIGYLGDGSGNPVMLLTVARHIDSNLQGWLLVQYPADSVRDNSNNLLAAGQGWINENTPGFRFLGGCDITRLPTTSDVVLTSTPTGTLTPIPCRAEHYDGITGADFLGRYARAEMAGDASLTESFRDPITALMVIQFNHFFFGRQWKVVSTVAGDTTAPYPSSVPQLPRQIAEQLITTYCSNGENIAATFNGALSSETYNEIATKELFQNRSATFEISFHPDHINAVESIPNYSMVAFQLSESKAIAIGTTADIKLDYQCATGITNYVQRDPNQDGGILNLIGSAECLAPSDCIDVDYWVVTQWNSSGQRIAAQLFEEIPDRDSEYYGNERFPYCERPSTS